MAPQGRGQIISGNSSRKVGRILLALGRRNVHLTLELAPAAV